MSADLRKIEESKRKKRARLAGLPFAEKLRILDQLRERSVALAANALRRRRTPPSARKGRQDGSP